MFRQPERSRNPPPARNKYRKIHFVLNFKAVFSSKWNYLVLWFSTRRNCELHHMDHFRSLRSNKTNYFSCLSFSCSQKKQQQQFLFTSSQVSLMPGTPRQLSDCLASGARSVIDFRFWPPNQSFFDIPQKHVFLCQIEAAYSSQRSKLPSCSFNFQGTLQSCWKKKELTFWSIFSNIKN